jgi:fructosamine-3-kinase
VITWSPASDIDVVRGIERAASRHLGSPWVADGFADLNERASHPCGIFTGQPFSVFAKFSDAPDGAVQFSVEQRGLDLLTRRSGVATPIQIGSVITVGDWSTMLSEAMAETAPAARSGADWRSIGRTLARLHAVTDEQFGLPEFDGFFGPLPQDNRPVATNRWSDFYVERRVEPNLRAAVDSGHLPPDLATAVSRLLPRVESRCGPESAPSLLHGDAQQNNFLSTQAGAVAVDTCPYYGHPEVDLALIDYIQPVPAAVFDAYREIAPIDAGFPERRELWRIHGYLAVVAVDGGSSFGRPYVDRLAEAVRMYS